MLAQIIGGVSTTTHEGSMYHVKIQNLFLYTIHFQLLFWVTWNDNAYQLDRYHDSNKNGVK